jgi:inorganic pyrophosphatase
MPTRLDRLPPYAEEGALRVVVESPRGSAIKFAFDPQLRMFVASRELPFGVVYPCDWGFIPGTKGEDGDPLDAMVLHPQASYPGVVFPCRILGMVEFEQSDGKGPPTRNNRVITTPGWHDTLASLRQARDLPAALRNQIEQFFLIADTATGKKATVKGWINAKDTRRFIDRSLA